MKSPAAILSMTPGLSAPAYAGLSHTSNDKPIEFERRLTGLADSLKIPLATGVLTLTAGIWSPTVNVKPRGIPRQARPRSEPNCAAQTK